MQDNVFDILIIGAGVTGAMIARKLSRYNIRVAVLDKENDVGNLTSTANSAIIHSGYDPLPGTLKAKLNVLGNPQYDKICEELDVPFKRIGSLTLAFDDEQYKTLLSLKDRATQNGVEVKILTPEETFAIEPNVSPMIKGALLAPSAGIIDPFLLVVGLMENAVDNGVKLYLNEEVVSITKQDDIFEIQTKNNNYYSRYVINAAGGYADKIAKLYDDIDWEITPRKGQYFLLNRTSLRLANHVLFPVPTEKGKGVLFTHTTAGNVIIGPTSEPVNDPEDVSCDGRGLAMVRNAAMQMVKFLPLQLTIKVFAGNRPTCTRHDFVIEPSKKDYHFINVGGIESPGLASSPAIADYVIQNYIEPYFALREKERFSRFMRKHVRVIELSNEDRQSLYLNNPEYGDMVCNCEQVSVAEIKDALSRSVPPHSIAAMRRRTRAGFGICQGGFCQSRVLMLMAEHYHVSPLDIPLDDKGSYILCGHIKEGL